MGLAGPIEVVIVVHTPTAVVHGASPADNSLEGGSVAV
jgi:hypothetical protein